jgi:ferritin-like metal-binding protein YciE
MTLREGIVMTPEKQEPAQFQRVGCAMNVQLEGKMGFFSKDIKSEDLLLHGLHDTYYDEQQITKALPKMIERKTNRDLAQGLKTHLDETNKQIERLDQVFKRLGKSPQSTDCPAIDGLIEEADQTVGGIDEKSVNRKAAS